jgi:hypothetical protein
MCHTDDLLKSLNDPHLCNYLFLFRALQIAPDLAEIR